MNKKNRIIFIESSTFLRGSDESPEEQPKKNVVLDSFAIDAIPVTNQQFRLFVEQGGYSNSEYWTSKGWEYIKNNQIDIPNYWLDTNWNQDDFPVTGVSWWEALAYAKFAGKTLPTEAQWEYACKGKHEYRYPWGNKAPTLEYANFAVDCDPTELERKATSVYAYPKNESYFGCLDLVGNLAEWCLDNASLNYDWDLTGRNPIFWTSEEDDHVVKGGCGLHNEEFLRCTSRDYYPASLRDNLVGFRCVINDVERLNHGRSN